MAEESINSLDKSSNITFVDTVSNSIEVLRIEKDRIWVNPNVSVDEAVSTVLKAIQDNIKLLIQTALKEEREACAILCEETLAQHYMKQTFPEKDESLLLVACAACADCASAIRARENT